MSNFFSTLFKWNWANIGKAIVGASASVLTLAATSAIVLPTPVTIAATVAVGIGSILGVHAYHEATPPGKISVPANGLDFKK